MNKTFIFAILLIAAVTILAQNSGKKEEKSMKYNELTPDEEYVILNKGTERPFTGKYVNHKEDGTYTCKRCDAPLYKSADKFDSHCGWPSFDDEIEGAVKRVPDRDGVRTEIVCANCGGHLGHVFKGEGFTDKNIRHCVNSISLNFVSVNATQTAAQEQRLSEAYFAGGCFWGVEYHFEKLDGVISAESGYMGGTVDNPTYEQVCSGRTGHAETVKITYNPDRVSYETLAKLFFETHDPTQLNRQGPDIGDQYRSVVFYADQEQKEITQELIEELKEKGYKVVTKVEKAEMFWPAEDYHQDYYEHKGTSPYCHIYTQRF
ncbi:bifunctional methionine sulfoxide reductase B/A protein [candidate division KSB1 bacterium]|nr:bifunctional methionine sulfoxide reductase B/A protein [candidate division KSB1 bacterium]